MPDSTSFRDVEATDPLVEAMSTDATLLGVWGFLRLSQRPLTLAEITQPSGLDPALVQRKLDMLCSYGIAESVPATARRRGTGYQACFQGLRIRCRKSGDHGMLRRVAAAMQQHSKDLLAPGWLETGPMESKGWHADYTGIFNLTPPEVDELRRRLNSVVEFATMLGSKQANRGGSPELCNYILTFRVEPLAKPALPLAPVRFVLAEVDDAEAAKKRPRSAGSELSAREREVAMALVRGVTVAEVAAELGIARSTAATITKRLYAKLGVHRRAELVSRIREELGDQG